MENTTTLEFCFKGNRTYVQGPDIFDATVEVLTNKYKIENITKIKYAAHEMLHANADLHILEDFNAEDFSVINSIITFYVNNQKMTAIVTENKEPIECSTPYSEELIRSNATINENRITFKNILEDSLTEIAVSMNKYFLQQTVPEKGKWIVTKFEYSNLTHLLEINNREIKLELTNNFNNKLTKSKIMVDDLLVGYLYFSLIEG